MAYGQHMQPCIALMARVQFLAPRLPVRPRPRLHAHPLGNRQASTPHLPDPFCQSARSCPGLFAGSPNVGWTLGAALAEGSRLGIGGARASALSISRMGVLHLGRVGHRPLGLLVAATGALLLFLAAALARRRPGGGGGDGAPGGDLGTLLGRMPSKRDQKESSDDRLPSLPLKAAEWGALNPVSPTTAALGGGQPHGAAGGMLPPDGATGAGLGAGLGLGTPPASPIYSRLFGTPTKKRMDPPARDMMRGWGSPGERDMRKDLSVASLARMSRSQAVSRRGISMTNMDDLNI
jgi:hypothetical protein